MKSLIVGGSSGIGAAIIRTLLGAGHEVAATYRTSIPPGLDAAAWVKADIRSLPDLDALAGPAENAGVVVLCRASPPARSSKSTRTTRSTRSSTLTSPASSG